MQAQPRGIGRLMRSFPARITVLVLTATLLTASFLATTSGYALHSFLSARIDEKFPRMLRDTTVRLSLWYAHLLVDVREVADGEAMRAVEHSTDDALKGEIEVRLNALPEVSALMLLDVHGTRRAWAGRIEAFPQRLEFDPPLPPRGIVHDLRTPKGVRLQVVSVPIHDSESQPVGSIHAVVDPAMVPAMLGHEQLGPTGLAFGRFGWHLVVEEPWTAAFAPALQAITQVFLMNLIAVLAFSGLAFALARRMVKPIRLLASCASRIADGDTDVVFPMRAGDDELGLLTHAFNQMSGTLHQNQLELYESRRKIEKANKLLRSQNEELQCANVALEDLSLTDGLTLLRNHRFFQEHLTREIACAEVQ